MIEAAPLALACLATLAAALLLDFAASRVLRRRWQLVFGALMAGAALMADDAALGLAATSLGGVVTVAGALTFLTLYLAAAAGSGGSRAARLLAGCAIGAAPALLALIAGHEPLPAAVVVQLALGAGLGLAAGRARHLAILILPALVLLVPLARGEPAAVWLCVATLAAWATAAVRGSADRSGTEPAELLAALHEPAGLLRHGQLVAANEALSSLLGGPVERLRRVRLIDLFPVEDAAWRDRALAGALPVDAPARLLALGGLRQVAVSFAKLPEARAMLLRLRDVEADRETGLELDFLRTHDPLTRLPLRAAFASALRPRLAGGPVLVVQLGLDDFRALNDLHGTEAGDAVLREVSRRLREIVARDGLVARGGGDEFLLGLPLGPNRAAAAALDRIQEALRAPVVVGADRLGVSASLGAARAPDDATDADALLALAETARRRARRGGPGRLALASTALDGHEREDRALAEELRHALVRREIELWYQPQARCADFLPTGFEALLRWRHPEHGLVSPARFVPIAEARGLMPELGAWALRRATAEAARWPVPLRVAVNVSPLQLLRGDLPGLVRGALEASGLPPARLEIEVTESAVLEPGERVRRQLEAIRALGVSLALDDFGTGQSSLATLREFRFDKIKLDRAFLAEAGFEAKGRPILRAVIALAQAVGAEVLAEGVESEAHAQILRAEGCDTMQGYLLSPPRPIDEFDELTGRTSSPAGPDDGEAGRQEAEGERDSAGVARAPAPADGGDQRSREQHREGEWYRGAQDGGELHVASAHQPAAPGQPQREQGGAGADRQQGRRRPASQDGFSQHQHDSRRQEGV